MKVVTLVPWRGGEEQREANWKITRRYLEQLRYPIFTGDSDGPWARAAACNAAARAAGDWDVALIADADTIPEPAAIRRAVREVGRGAIRPHDRLYNLTRSQSLLLARRGPQALRLGPRPRLLAGGGLLVISRAAWERVGGYDERFVGWGHEDSALATTLLVKASWDRIPGQAWHLWHPRDPIDTPERKANWDMMRRLQLRYRGVIARESRRRGWDVGAHL